MPATVYSGQEELKPSQANQKFKCADSEVRHRWLPTAEEFFLRSIRFSKEINMSRLTKKTNRILSAVLGLLLVGSAVAFAQHNTTLARIFATPAKVVALAVGQPVSEVASDRPGPTFNQRSVTLFPGCASIAPWCCADTQRIDGAASAANCPRGSF